MICIWNDPRIKSVSFQPSLKLNLGSSQSSLNSMNSLPDFKDLHVLYCLVWQSM